MEKILYLECYSGISGDMTVGALLDLGADRAELERVLESMDLEGYHLHFGRTTKCGIDAFNFDVHLEHTHDETDEHGHNDHHDHHQHSHDEASEHEHTHTHHGHHQHRNINDINKIIDHLEASDRVKNLAKEMFAVVARAEAKAHGLPVDEVHFHEVGAIDSIVDIIGVAVCIDNLEIQRVIVSTLFEGTGYVKCQHGIIPVPVPATANIVAEYGLKLKITDSDGEMITPTGATIAAVLNCGEALPGNYTIKKIGIGAGKKDFRQANVVRAMLIEETHGTSNQIWQLETNIDDCSGEALGFAMECLLEAGAADVWYTPIYMKKNRPAYLLSVLCETQQIEDMEDIIFAQTTTVGIRRRQIERTVLQREIRSVMTPYGKVEVKACIHKGSTYFYPEYEDVKAICREQHKTYNEVYREILDNV